MRRRLLLVCASVTLAVLPMAAPAQERSAADIAALTVCLINADIAFAAIPQMLAGRSEEEVLRAAEQNLDDAAYRGQALRVINSVYRVRPPAARPYVAQHLEGCVGRNAPRAQKARADACYQLTLFARDLFAARNAGVPLEEARARLAKFANELAKERARDDKLGADLAARLERMAVNIYGSGGKDHGTQVAQYRTALFVECVAPRADR
jgi:hypothetical protein